jgi:hexosaminidase
MIIKINSFWLFIVTFHLSCKAISSYRPTLEEMKKPIPINIIPQPQKLIIGDGFAMLEDPQIFTDTLNLSEYVRKLIASCGAKICSDTRIANILVNIDKNLARESYKLIVESQRISITVSSSHGLQYALESLHMIRQEEKFPMVEIEDSPKFGYRGMHLDVCRHFFSVEEIKKYLDYLARYKYNRFHWHLTEDQGWRIEIKKYPKLQEVAAWRKETLIGHYNDQPQKYDGKRYGGFYTQDQVKEIVNYAASRHITVIPEIEIPGHSLAALAAYPQLGCTGGPYEVATTWGVFDDVYCPTELTFTFLFNVLDEVIPLFPSQYIHIGGDECPKRSWKESDYCQQLMKREGLKDEYELQAFFIKQIAAYVKAKHKKTIIGWDEILEGNLTDNNDDTSILSSPQDRPVIMSWRGTEGGVAAAKANHYAIMTPGSHCYFDHYQSQKPTEPIAIGGYTDVKKVYHWQPIPKELSVEEQKYILGGQANVWTEYISSFSQVEYMAYARGLAMSEVLWGTNINYLDFQKRFEIHQNQLKSKGINMANHQYELKPILSKSKSGFPTVGFSLYNIKNIIVSDGKEKIGSINSDKTYELKSSGSYHFSIEDLPSETYTIDYLAHKATRAHMKMPVLPAEQYKGSGPESIINGILGSNKKYKDDEWLGFFGKDISFDLEWEEPVDLSTLKFRFFKAEGQWIYLPQEVVVSIINSKGEKMVKQFSVVDKNEKICTTDCEFKANDIISLSILIKNHGVIAEGNQGAGHKAWTFIDEVIAE